MKPKPHFHRKTDIWQLSGEKLLVRERAQCLADALGKLDACDEIRVREMAQRLIAVTKLRSPTTHFSPAAALELLAAIGVHLPGGPSGKKPTRTGSEE